MVIDFETSEPRGDFALDVGDSLGDPLAAVAFRVAVAQLDRLVNPGRRARRYDRASVAAIGVRCHRGGGVTARIEHLPRAEPSEPSHDSEVYLVNSCRPGPEGPRRVDAEAVVEQRCRVLS